MENPAPRTRFRTLPEVSLNSRKAAHRFLVTGLGAAAQALADREAKRAGEEQKTKEAYLAAVSAIAAE